MRAVALLLAAAACGGKAVPAGAPSMAPSGAGNADAGTLDAGTLDAGIPDAGAPDAGPQSLAAPPAGELYHGVIPLEAGVVTPAALDAYEQAAGRDVAYVYFDDEWHDSRAFPLQMASWIRDRGAFPFVRLMLRSQRVPLVTDPVFTLDRIIAGDFDSDLAAWADAAHAFGTPLAVEYGTEVNGDWNPWSAPYNGGLDVGPAKFRAAYRHIVQVMRPRAPNITWALHYAGQSFPGDDPRNVPSAYYPGDDVVDWIGLSIYGSERSNDHRCNSFRSLVDDMLPQLPAGKPLFVFEFGNTRGNPACPAGPWVRAAFDDLLAGRWPLRGFCWWQQKFGDDASVGGFTDYLVQDDPDVTAAFRAALASPRIVDHPLGR